MSNRQLNLPIQDARYRRPTMSVDTAKGILDLSEDEIGNLVDDGTLVAFDIKHPAAERRDLRLLTWSVAEYSKLNPDRSPCYHNMIPPTSAISDLLPHEKPFFTGKEIKRLLNCGRQHLINLVTSKALLQVPGTKYRPGPKGWPVITRESFITFLQTRIIGGL